MALDFPSSPTLGPPPTTYGRWVWNGTSWVTAPAAAIPYLPLTGGTLTGPLVVDDDTAIDGDLSVTGGVTADHLTTTGTSIDCAGDAVIHGDLSVHGDADFDAVVRIQGDPIATVADVNEAVDAVKNLGLYAGSFATYAAVPTNRSGFPHLTANDFITVQADETHADATTRYVASAIAADGSITWTYDITYSTDVTGKMDLVAGATDGHLAMLDTDGQAEDAGFAESDLFVLSTATTFTQGTDFNDATEMVGLFNNRRFDDWVTVTITTDQGTSPQLKNVFIPQFAITINTEAQIAANLGIRGIYGGSLIINSSTTATPFITSAAMTIADASVVFQGIATIGTNLGLTRNALVSIDAGGWNTLNVTGTLTIGAGCTLNVLGNLNVTGTVINNGLLIFGPSSYLSYWGTVTGSGQTIDNRGVGYPEWSFNPIETFARKALSLTKGVAGTYDQVGEMPGGDFQAFLDQSVNNKWFDGPLTLTLDFDTTTPVYIGNVFFNRRVNFRIITSAQIGSTLNLTNIRGCDYLDIVCTAPLACGSLTCDSVSVRFSGTTTYGGTTTFQGVCYAIFGTAPTDNLYFPTMSISAASAAVISNTNPTLTIDTLTNNGRFDITSAITNLTFTLAAASRGQIIDNRANNPLDTYQRAIPPPLAIFTRPGTYDYVVPRTGRYLAVCCGPGGGGSVWFGNPWNTTTGSVPQMGAGGTGAIVRNENLLTAGQKIQVKVAPGGYGGVGGFTATNGMSAPSFGGHGDSTWIGMTGIWAMGGQSGALVGQTPGAGWGGNAGGPSTGYVLINGTHGTQQSGGSDVTWTYASTYYGSLQFSGGKGGAPGATGRDGTAALIYMGPT